MTALIPVDSSVPASAHSSSAGMPPAGRKNSRISNAHIASRGANSSNATDQPSPEPNGNVVRAATKARPTSHPAATRATPNRIGLPGRCPQRCTSQPKAL